MALKNDWEIFLSDLALDLAKFAAEYSKPSIPSDTLQQHIETRKVPGGAEMLLRYYWAVYLHYGREPARPVKSLYLVFFRDWKDDPRLSQGYPRSNPPRRLTKAEMQTWSKRNKAARALGKPEPMVVVAKVAEDSKYSKPGFSHPALFWSNRHGMKGFGESMRPYISKKITEFLRTRLYSHRET